MNVAPELRDVLSWLSAVVPSGLRECRNIDGSWGSKCFFKNREHGNVSNLHCLSLFSGQQQDPGFDDRNKLSLPPLLLHSHQSTLQKAEPTRGSQLAAGPSPGRDKQQGRRGTGRKGKSTNILLFHYSLSRTEWPPSTTQLVTQTLTRATEQLQVSRESHTYFKEIYINTRCKVSTEQKRIHLKWVSNTTVGFQHFINALLQF